jgi:hypothetical protein
VLYNWDNKSKEERKRKQGPYVQKITLCAPGAGAAKPDGVTHSRRTSVVGATLVRRDSRYLAVANLRTHRVIHQPFHHFLGVIEKGFLSKEPRSLTLQRSNLELVAVVFTLRVTVSASQHNPSRSLSTSRTINHRRPENVKMGETEAAQHQSMTHSSVAKLAAFRCQPSRVSLGGHRQ